MRFLCDQCAFSELVLLLVRTFSKIVRFLIWTPRLRGTPLEAGASSFRMDGGRH